MPFLTLLGEISQWFWGLASFRKGVGGCSCIPQLCHFVGKTIFRRGWGYPLGKENPCLFFQEDWLENKLDMWGHICLLTPKLALNWPEWMHSQICSHNHLIYLTQKYLFRLFRYFHEAMYDTQFIESTNGFTPAPSPKYLKAQSHSLHI